MHEKTEDMRSLLKNMRSYYKYKLRINLHSWIVKSVLFVSLVFVTIYILHQRNFTSPAIVNIQNNISKKFEGIIWGTHINTTKSVEHNNNNNNNNITILRNPIGRNISSSSSHNASLLGIHQKVISYSFLNNHPGYSKGINEIMNNVSILYPGWKVRIYASGEDISYLKRIMKERDFVFYYDIENLSGTLKSVRAYPVTQWRFAPLGDPQMDVLMFRDTDSEKILWPAFKKDSISHDSYLCRSYSRTSPWPTKRNAQGRYVGAAVYKSTDGKVKEKCPVKCRPKKHRNWKYC